MVAAPRLLLYLGAPLFWGKLDRDNSGLCGPVPTAPVGELGRESGLRSEQREGGS
jgi:hypothetical protein